MVDIHSTRYAIARRYMIRLRRDDFEDQATVKKFAEAARLSPDEFRKQFAYLVEHEAPLWTCSTATGLAPLAGLAARLS
jgi:6-phosphofructokinase 1